MEDFLPEIFTGESGQNCLHWLQQFERHAELVEWEKDEIVKYFELCTRGAAFRWNIKGPTTESFEQRREACLHYFGPIVRKEQSNTTV